MKKNNIQKFVYLLFEVLESDEYKNYIWWTTDGKYFVIPNHKQFQEKVMVNTFNTNNIQSFLRQLSIYKFKMQKDNQNQKQYFNPNFQKGRRDLLCKIQRNKKEQQQNESLDQVISLDQIKIQNQKLWVELQQLKINQQYILKQLIIQTKIQASLSNSVMKIAQDMAYTYGEDCCNEYGKPMRLFFKMIQGYRTEYLERILTFLTLEKDIPTPIQENYSPVQFPYY